MARYAEKKDLASYDRETLRSLIDRVDRRVASELGSDGWRALLSPLYDLADALPEFSDGLPGPVLAEVFAARGRPGLGAAVVSEDWVSREALAGLLAEALAPEPVEADDPQPEPPEVLAIEPEDPVLAGADDEQKVIEDAVEVETSTDDGQDEVVGREESVGRITLAETLAGIAAGTSAESGSQPGPPFPETEREETTSARPASGQRVLTEPTVPESSGAEQGDESDPQADPSLSEPTEEEPDDEPLWARLARERSAPPPAVAPSQKETEPDDGEPLWQRFASGSPSAPLAEAAVPPTTSISADEIEARVLGENADQRDRYVEALFGGDEANYHRVLGLLYQAPSWSAATEIIGREVFRRYHVHIYSEPAASFTDAVERQYSRG